MGGRHHQRGRHERRRRRRRHAVACSGGGSGAIRQQQLWSGWLWQRGRGPQQVQVGSLVCRASSVAAQAAPLLCCWPALCLPGAVDCTHCLLGVSSIRCLPSLLPATLPALTSFACLLACRQEMRLSIGGLEVGPVHRLLPHWCCIIASMPAMRPAALVPQSFASVPATRPAAGCCADVHADSSAVPPDRCGCTRVVPFPALQPPTPVWHHSLQVRPSVWRKAFDDGGEPGRLPNALCTATALTQHPAAALPSNLHCPGLQAMTRCRSQSLSKSVISLALSEQATKAMLLRTGRPGWRWAMRRRCAAGVTCGTLEFICTFKCQGLILSCPQVLLLRPAALQMVDRLAAYLDVPLRYPLALRGSRSAVIDSYPPAGTWCVWCVQWFWLCSACCAMLQRQVPPAGCRVARSHTAEIAPASFRTLAQCTPVLHVMISASNYLPLCCPSIHPTGRTQRRRAVPSGRCLGAAAAMRRRRQRLSA